MGKINTAKLITMSALAAGAFATGGFGLLGAAATEGAVAGAAGTAGATGAVAGTTGAAAGAAGTSGATAGLAGSASKGVLASMTKKSIATGLLAGASVYQAGNAKMQADYLNSVNKAEELQESYNATMEQKESELNLATKENEIQKNLARTIASQNNLFGARGQNTTFGGSAANIMEGSAAAAKKDEDYLHNMTEYKRKAFNNNSAFRQASYYSARKGNQMNANSQALGNLLTFGLATYK